MKLDHRHRLRIFMVILLMITGLFSITFYRRADSEETGAEDAKKTILIINSYNPGYQWLEDLEKGLLENLSFDNSTYDLYIEYMDTKNHPPQEVFPDLVKLYAKKYSFKQPDVIISADNNAFNFLKENRDTLFPGVPVVFCGVNDYHEEMLSGFENVTGVAEAASFDETIKLALELFPSTKTIYSIAGSAETTKIHIDELDAVSPVFKDRVVFKGIHELSMAEFKTALNDIPSDSIVLYLGLYRDTKGKLLSVKESFSFIRRYTGQPVITMWSQNLPYCFGGVMISGQEQGRRASAMALQILSGEDPASIPVIKKSPNLPMFNYDELKRFSINPGILPPDSVIINVPSPSFYSQYKIQIWAVIITILLLSLLSVFLTINIVLRRKTMIALQSARSYISSIIDSMPSILIGVDNLLEVTKWNRAAEEMSGISAEDALGKPIETVIPRLTDEIPNVREAIRSKEICSKARKLYEENGEKKYADITIFPLLSNGHEGAVIRMDDVTERVRVEELRLQSKTLKEQLMQAQKMESIGRLAGGIAHDLNNLLVPVIGYAEMLDGDDQLLPDHHNSVNEIYKAGMRARDLIRQLLAFSRKQNLDIKSVDLNDVISNFYTLLRRTIRENVEIELDLHPGELFIMADVGQIEQVIMNLAVNAKDSISKDGKITISTRFADPEGKMSYLCSPLAKSRIVQLEISDTGMGMDEGVQKKIFEPFFSTKGKQGTGLGLATAYGIIKQHKGNIEVESEPGMGTTFLIYLPTSVNARMELKEDEERQFLQKGIETILIVEDNEQVLNLAQIILAHCGYNVLTASNGKNALSMVDSLHEHIDLLLTDVVMPEINGKELYSLAALKYPELKVLYMSGYNDNIISNNNSEEDGLPFIQKPFTAQILTQKVRSVLEDR